MSEELIKRLRNTADVMDDWDPGINPPLTDWRALMEEAADALEAYEEDEGTIAEFVRGDG